MPGQGLASQPASKRERYAFIDALRGLAALAVVVFHVSGITLLRSPTAETLPEFARHTLQLGMLGVQVFFAISGFVIFYAIGSQHIDTRFVARFMARRSVRLDPPYWATIGVAVALAALTNRILGERVELPSFSVLAAHALYLQNILNLGNLSMGLWTLCIEMQFYLFALAVMAVWQRLRLGTTTVGVVLVCLVVTAAALYTPTDSQNPSVVFNSYRSLLPNLVLFGCGTIPWLILERKAPQFLMAIVVIAIAARCLVSFSTELLAAALAGISFWAAVRTGGIERWLKARPLQFLGRISYSLYLIHPAATLLSKRVLHRILGDGVVFGYLGFIAGVAFAVLAAWALHVAIEAPFVRLARRINLRRGDAAAAAVFVTASSQPPLPEDAS